MVIQSYKSSKNYSEIMRILITNDDGINATGLKVLETIARSLTNEENIFIIAPTSERSGVAHCVSYNEPMLLDRISKNRYSVSGSGLIS